MTFCRWSRQLAFLFVIFGSVESSITSAFATDVTFDISNYHYREEDDSGNFQMHDKSLWPFVSAGIRDWDRPETDDTFGLMYTTEATIGRTRYLGRRAGTQRKWYYKGRAEGYLAYRANDIFTPLAGLGYRILYDNSGGHPTQDGGIAYDRKNQLIYLVLGTQIDPAENWTLKAQANVLLRGWQHSYLADTNPNYPTATNIQDTGYGLDFTANYQLSNNWSTYGFARYWDIERSSTKCGIVSGSQVCWWEPDNTTKEIGLGVAYKF